MKRGLLLGLAIAWQMPALGADPIPPHLTGVWATADSLYAGTTAQSELYLQADGSGMIIGSPPPPVRLDGPERGTAAQNMRAVLGLPLRAVAEAEVLTLHPFWKGAGPGAEKAGFSCRYLAQGPALACVGSDRRDMLMKRRSSTVPPDAVAAIGAVFAEASATIVRAGAPRPGSSTLP